MNERRYCARTTIDYFSSLSAKRFIDRETIGCREKRSPRGLKNIKREKLIEAKREKQNKLFFFDSIKRLALLEWSSNWRRASWRRRERVRVTFLRFKISSLRCDDERRVKFSRIFTIRPRKKPTKSRRWDFPPTFHFMLSCLLLFSFLFSRWWWESPTLDDLVGKNRRRGKPMILYVGKIRDEKNCRKIEARKWRVFSVFFWMFAFQVKCRATVRDEN